MSITTKHGDSGSTRLLFGASVSKNHPTISAVGEIDELNAVLGLARIHAKRNDICSLIARAQEDLVAIMGMISSGKEEESKYATLGFRRINQESVERLTLEAATLESEFPLGFNTWSVPGSSGDISSTWLELARCVCRRAERSVVALPESPALITAWLNRLSDLLWLAARCEENHLSSQE